LTAYVHVVYTPCTHVVKKSMTLLSNQRNLMPAAQNKPDIFLNVM